MLYVSSPGVGSGYTRLHLSGCISGAGSTVLATGEWYHMAMTRSGNDVKLYLNGSEEASGTGAFTGGSSNIAWAFGGRMDLPQQTFSGNIDEIAIYSDVLTEEQIRYHYQMGIPEPSTLVLLIVGGFGLLVFRRWRK